MSAAVDLRLDRKLLEQDVRAFERKLERIAASIVPQAEMRALNHTATKARTEVTRELARAKQIPQKAIRGRVQIFRATPKRRVATVWIGVKRRLYLEDIAGARLVTQGKRAGELRAGRLSARPFKARLRSGKVMLAVRVEPGSRWTAGRPVTSSPNLPIDRPHIVLMPEARPVLERVALRAMRTYYPREYRRLLNAAVNKLRV